MSAELPLACTCGRVQGRVRGLSPKRGNHLVCYCDDCQAFAHWLERADELLDEHGGTEVFQVTPAQLEIDEGRELLRCLRLSESGLMRWYASCCNTPVANMLAQPKFPFAGVSCRFMAEANENGQPRDELLGPVIGRIHARYGLGELPPDAHPTGPLWLVIRALRLVFRGWVRKLHAPSPFYDGASLSWVSEPEVLSEDERERLRPLCGALRER